MKLKIMLCVALLSAAAFAQSTSVNPRLAFCWNAASSQWVAMAAPLIGSAVSYTPNPVALYGQNGSLYYPIQCNASGSLIGSTNPNPYDVSSQVATDAFVIRSVNLQMGTAILSNITGGTYSFDSQGSGALMNYQVSNGAISSITTWIPSVGSGYAIGDIITPQAGNYDALVVITNVSGGVPSAGTILYGGTGYTAGTSVVQTGANAVQFTFILNGALTSPATFIMPYGSYLTTSNQWLWANNTTGAYSVTVCQAGATNACSGGRTVVIPQGTNNSAEMFISTDGVLNVDQAEGAVNNLWMKTAAYTNAPYNAGTCNTSITLDPANGLNQYFSLTEGAACQMSFTQPSGKEAALTLTVYQSTSSTFNGTWATGTCTNNVAYPCWPGGSAGIPTPTVGTGTTGTLATNDIVTCKLDGTLAKCIGSGAQNFQ